LYRVLLIHLGTGFHPFLIKMKRCHPLMGHCYQTTMQEGWWPLCTLGTFSFTSWDILA
jgi:hypothetical protein